MNEKKYLGPEGLARLVANIKVGYADKESVEILERKLERIPEYDLDDIVGSIGKAEYTFEPRPDDIPKVFMTVCTPWTRLENLNLFDWIFYSCCYDFIVTCSCNKFEVFQII